MSQKSHYWTYTLSISLRYTCIPMFLITLFIILRTWKQPRCSSTDEWIKKLWYTDTMEYYSDIKRNKFDSVLVRWMNLASIITEWSKSESVKVLITQSCLTLCDPMDCSPPGSSVQGVLQARILKRERQISHTNTYIWNLENWYWWTYLQSSNGDPDIENRLVNTGRGGEGGPNRKSSIETCMHAKSPQSCRLCATQWTVAHRAPLSMKFSKRKYWSGLPFPSPGTLPHSGTEPASPVLADGFFTTSAYSNCWKVGKIKEWSREFTITLKSKMTSTLSHTRRLFFPHDLFDLRYITW